MGETLWTVESNPWCKGVVRIKFLEELEYLTIGKKQDMLNNNATRKKMVTISYRHKGVVDLIC
jgi:hypothetical protein